jgi:formate hydrogenlyase subunit 6/NADH:ubiquinone oxidoreductase subunit I
MKDGKAIVVAENCAFCGGCVDVCPEQAIKMEE